MPKAAAGMIPQVDAYIAKSAPFARPVLLHVRDVVHEAAPGVVEAIKWSRPFFVYHGIVLGNMAAFKQHCSFGLWGKEIAAVLRADGVASSEGMGTFGKIGSVAELPPRKQLVAYVREAVKAIDEGVRTKSYTRPKVAKKELVVSPALMAALKKNRAALAKFAAMTPSCKREYSVWIDEAKRDETRDKRIATALEWITEGKHRHWKYQA
jgi:uncharacterized protein YdeI (YjbR/CyaY-like superfamily)